MFINWKLLTNINYRKTPLPRYSDNTIKWTQTTSNTKQLPPPSPKVDGCCKYVHKKEDNLWLPIDMNASVCFEITICYVYSRIDVLLFCLGWVNLVNSFDFVNISFIFISCTGMIIRNNSLAYVTSNLTNYVPMTKCCFLPMQKSCLHHVLVLDAP